MRRLSILLLLAFVASIPAEEPNIEQLQKQIAELEAKLATLKKEQAADGGKKRLGIADTDKWRSIRSTALSNNGKWFAHRVGPAEGDGEVILRNLTDDKETKFPGGSGFGTLQISFDSKWLLFSVSPSTPRNQSPMMAAIMPRAKPKYVLVNLTTNEKKELEGYSSAQFNGETVSHLALRKSTESTAPSGGPTLPPGISLPPGLTLPSSATATVGTPNNDLVLYTLATGDVFVLGNVAEFSFDKKGNTLVMVIDAANQIGNGVQLRDMKTGSVTPIETGKASYRALSWHEDYTAFSVVKAVEDTDYDGKWNTILGFTDIGGKPVKHSYDPREDKSFPKNMGISNNRPVLWTKGLDAFSFGIAEQKKKDIGKKAETAPTPQPSTMPPGIGGGRRGIPTSSPTASTSSTSGQPDLVIWHWKDERLQPMQQVQASSDKAYTYSCLYHVKDKKFVQLADDSCRNVSLGAGHKYAIGTDVKPYEYMSNLDGRRYSDIYAIDIKTGSKKKILTKSRFNFGVSTSGDHYLYYDDGHFYTCELATGKTTNITAKITATQFVDIEDDHNVVKPPTRPLGWSKDGKFVVISDGWDLWKVAADGSGGENLTVNGKKDGIRYSGINQYEPERKEPGFDFSKPALTNLYGEWTKKDGIGQIQPGKPGVTVLYLGDCSMGFVQKSRNADVYTFTKETAVDAPNYYVCDSGFKNHKKVSEANPQQKDYHWTSGVKLIDYKAMSGRRHQAALYLPANYKPGDRYPTVVYIYEKLSQGLHNYSAPSTGSFNKSIYTSNGYAVLMPDITYKLNDPGKSAVECINAALDAAIATGIVDADKLGLQGHSWGGYQTAYTITQTSRFKAACAGAPLTDLVSMYSSVYWNSGSANQPIFESSQGRFTSGYWDQQEAYIRNSPVYFAKNVVTPLLLLHNDKDGAVDFTQGIEYYNTLRRLQKPVVMLQYKGENHGLAKPENRKDYAVRMKEFFDCHLLGKEPPDWWKSGVPHLKMDEHLKGRKQ